jgi:hypothetical protein
MTIRCAACLAPISLFAMILLITGCGSKPPDVTTPVRERIEQFQLHLIRGEIDGALALLDPELVEKRGPENCKQVLSNISAGYKKQGLKEGDIRIDKIDANSTGRQATIHLSQQIKGKWNAAQPVKWVNVKGKWYYSP